MNYEVNQPYPVAPRKSFPWGCLLGGCCVVMLLMAGGIGATGFFAYRFYQSQMARYTSDQQAELPTVDASEAEVEQLQTRVASFKEKLEEDQADEPLVLSEKELNLLIRENDELSDKVYVKIQDDLLTAEVSVPLDMLPGGKGRYFNGSVTLDAEIEKGRLEVYLLDAEVRGEEIPEEILSQLGNENLAKDVNYKEDTKKWIERFESIEVVGDKIVLTPVKQSDSKTETNIDSANSETTETDSPEVPAAESSPVEDSNSEGDNQTAKSEDSQGSPGVNGEVDSSTFETKESNEGN